MARFTYKCDKCNKVFKVSLEKRASELFCNCGGTGKPIFTVGSTKIMERLDNGAMARAVERIHNIEEITNADSDSHSTVPEDEDA